MSPTPNTPAVEGKEPGQELFEPSGDFRIILVAIVASIGLHIGGVTYSNHLAEVYAFLQGVRNQVADNMAATIDIDEFEPPPPPEPEEVYEEPEPEPEEESPVEPPPEPVAVDETLPPTEEAPPPAAAEASEVLTSEPDPNEPLDLTGEGFVTGNGTRFAGGITASTGTSKTAVRNRNARGPGIQGSKGKTEGAAGPPPIDKSRPPRLSASSNWDCPFPSEADSEQINQADVRVVVVVNASGAPTSVTVLSSPGFGFDRAARKCAMRQRYEPGLDQKGNPTSRAMPPIRVKFRR